MVGKVFKQGLRRVKVQEKKGKKFMCKVWGPYDGSLGFIVFSKKELNELDPVI